VAIELRLFGPVELWVDARRVGIGPAKQRAVLVALTVDANHVLSPDQLVSRIWDETPPPASRNVLHTYIGRLRRAIEDVPGLRVLRQSGGYLLEIDPDMVDLLRFRRLVDAARVTSDEPGKAELLRQALRATRGEAFAGLAGDWLDGQRVACARERVTAVCDLADIELRRGEHERILPDLRELVAAYPLDERLIAQLILALYRSGRQAEAIDCYQQCRRQLADEMGIDPSRRLTELYARVLRQEDIADAVPVAVPTTVDAPPAVGGRTIADPPALATVSAQLPRDPRGFTGRLAELASLHATLAEELADIITISGMAGVGKTALALHFAHRVAPEFPDGQLYLNLRGHESDQGPMTAGDALGQFLRALGVDSRQVPDEPEERAARYRSLLASRRLLIVLDNAASAEQVRQTLPGSQGCLVLVTSRDRLSGLTAFDGAWRLDLDVLTVADSTRLLSSVIGADRVAAESRAASELIQSCAYLPLALRIVAANLADHPDRNLSDAVTDLARPDRLTALAIVGDERAAVARTFDLSYTALADPLRRLFRLLGLVPGADFTAPVAAALVASTLQEATARLAALAAAHLVEPLSAGRYRLHDLLRFYALARVELEDARPGRDRAMQRLLDWYQRTADAAAALVYPDVVRLAPERDEATVTQPLPFGDRDKALMWFEAERANLVAATQSQVPVGTEQAAWRLADALRGFFLRRRYTDDWLATATAGLRSARRAGDRRAEAAMLTSLANAGRALGRYHEAIEHYSQALTLHRDLDWPAARAAAFAGLGLVRQEIGDLRRAVVLHGQALAINRRIGMRQREAVDLNNLGLAYLGLGRLEPAARYLAHSLELSRQTASTSGETASRNNLATAHHLLGRFEAAIDDASAALALSRQDGSRSSEAEALNTLAAVHRDAGHHEVAFRYAGECLALAQEIGDRRMEAEASNTLGETCLRDGDPKAAGEHFSHACRIARAIANRYGEAAALCGLAAVDQEMSRTDEATGYARHAMRLARRAGLRITEGTALTLLGGVAADTGRAEQAAGFATHAARIQAQAGHRLGEARALTVLGRVLLASQGTEAAVAPWRHAWEIFTTVGTTEATAVRALLDDADRQSNAPAALDLP
jgi:DNA-binding SARP family transcriptional activator